jgi:transposase
MAGWIAGPVADRVPGAVRCVDPFHVVMLATDALDEVRREVWNEARKAGEIAAAKDLKDARFALWKNPENLTDRQQAKLSSIQKTNARLYRAYLLKEQLRQIYRLPAQAAIGLLDEWIAWARRCRLPSFVKLAKDHHDAARQHRQCDHTRPLQRSRRGDQHPDPHDHPTRLRVPQPRRADRTGDAVTRRALPATPR